MICGETTAVVTFALASALCCCLLGCAPAIPYAVPGGSEVERDELVIGWSVNGERVARKGLLPAPGCYVLGVTYRKDYDYVKGKGPDRAVSVASPALAMIEASSRAEHKEYEADQIPFALTIRAGHSYWVTATFTGDAFLGRVIERDAAGEKTAVFEPARSVQELRECEAKTPPAR